jgi:hypothetical protein
VLLQAAGFAVLAALSPTAFNTWLLAHGRTLLVLALMVGGAVLAANGILGLVRGG